MSALLVLAYDLDPGRIVRPGEVESMHEESGNPIKQSC